jgi:hypothetical protein
MNERVYTRTHAERVALINEMRTNGKWTLSAIVESSDNTYYLFASKANECETIGINDGVSDFFEDVIYTDDPSFIY